MRMNHRMSVLLEEAGIPVSFASCGLPEPTGIPTLIAVDGSILLKDEYEKARHVRVEDFPDKTGFECFVNHVHFPFKGVDSLRPCLGYATTLQHALRRLAQGRSWQLIVSVADSDCTIRFHEIRPGQAWIAEDLEAYESEAILTSVVELADC